MIGNLGDYIKSMQAVRSEYLSVIIYLHKLLLSSFWAKKGVLLSHFYNIFLPIFLQENV